MNTTIDAVVKGQRLDFSKLGALFGLQYFKVESRGGIANFNEELMKVKNGGDIELFLNRNITRYQVKSYNVTKVEVKTDAADAPVVYINEGLDGAVVIPVTPNMANSNGMVTTEAIKKAICGDTNVFFADPKELVTTVNNLNAAEATRIDSLIERLSKMKQGVMGASTNNTQKLTTYLAELNANPVSENNESSAMLHNITVTVSLYDYNRTSFIRKRLLCQVTIER